jgi:hypothetical protein
MATELEDHNEGQKDGTDAGFLDTMAVEWNPLLSTAYKQGFRHAVQQQSKKKVQEKPPERQDEARASEKRSAETDEDEGMPWILSLLLAFFVIIISGVVVLLRWIIQRPWRVAVGLLVIGGIALFSRQTERHQEAAVLLSEAPTSVSQPTAADVTPSAAQTSAPAMAIVNSTPSVAAQKSGFAFLGEFSNEAELNSHFDPEAEPRAPYRVQLWKDEKVGIVGHVFYPVQEADSPAARIQLATFDKASGKISFQARISAGSSFPENQPQYAIHMFAGFLKDGMLQGTFSRQDEGMKYAAVKEDVILKRGPSDEQLEHVATLAKWESEYSRLVIERWR